MTVDDLMTPHPASCSPDTSLEDVARMMADHDCGEIPIVDHPDGALLVGVVTDRDIVVRLVARGKNPLELTAESCMTAPVVSVKLGSRADDSLQLMQIHQIRRVPVVDETGALRGIVSQADVARHATPNATADVVREISEKPAFAPA